MVRKLPDHRLVWNMAKLQELVLVTTWLWFRHVHNDAKSTNARIMATQAKNQTLAKQWIVQAMKKENKLFNQQEQAKQDIEQEAEKEVMLENNPEVSTISPSAPGGGSSRAPPATFEENVTQAGFTPVNHPSSNSQQPWGRPPKASDINNHEALVFLLQGSPKLHMLLLVIQQEIFDFSEKSIVWCANPAQQFFVAAALGLARIDAEVYHAELSTTERQDLLHQFTMEQDSCMVLICSYYINSAGSNMQAQC